MGSAQKTPYHLYLDESGDLGKYRDKKGRVIPGSSRYFTLAGIIVEEGNRRKMENRTNHIVYSYFNKKLRRGNFKLHFSPLRNKQFPYNQLSGHQRNKLTNEVFSIIEKSDCFLLSVTVDLEKHYSNNVNPFNPQAYVMLLMLERFQGFLEKKNGHGKVIYEKFDKKMRKNVRQTMREVREGLRHLHYKELGNIKEPIENGNPKTQPILQLVDFFAYAVWIKEKKKREGRLDSIKHKYFRLNEGGNVMIKSRSKEREHRGYQ